MKKIILCFFLAALCGCFVACSSNEDSVVNLYRNSQFLASSMENDSLEFRYNSIDVQEYIDLYPDIFGENVQVFESLEEVDELLNQISEFSPEELRSWYSETNCHSRVIESNIIYDSVLYSCAEKYGIDFDTDNDEQYYNELMDDFIDVMRNEYAVFCHFGIDTIEDEIVECVNPFGNIDDLSAFTNDNGIVIVDKVVYKFLGGYLITCPIDVFVQVPISPEITYYFMEEAAGLLPEEYCISALSPCLPTQETEYEDIKSHIVRRGNYKLSVYITAYPVWSWGKTNVRAKTIISNYYRGNKLKTDVYGHIGYEVLAYFPNRNCTMKRWFGFSRNDVTGRYKSKTLRETQQGNFYCPTTRVTIDFTRVEIYVLQENSGLSISYKK